MRWYVNDLSLQGQFPTPQEFLRALVALVQLRARSQFVRERLYCSRAFGQRAATPDRDCRSAVTVHAQREEKRLILVWITTHGPFIEDDRLQELDDYFEFQGHDVTDQGLGEAARRMSANTMAGVFSFLRGAINFERSPLRVQHGLPEAPIKFVDIENVWDPQRLEERAQAALAQPVSWAELIEFCRLKYDRIWISDAVLERLSAETFYPNVADRTIELLRVLQDYMQSRRSGGSLSPRGHELYQQYFTGDRARFSDESDDNKRAYKKEMTFPDPSDGQRQIFCPWHGKIQTPQFRIHFEWPVPAGRQRLRILYVGPKITKQ